MTSIKTKLLPVIIIGIALMAGLGYIFSMQTQSQNLQKITVDGLVKSRNTFVNLQQDDIKMLKIGILNFLANSEAFLKGERESFIKAYASTFEKAKSLGQSVFQFNKYDPAKPENLTVFARVHNPIKSGDPVKRTANRLARETKDWSYGIDLGNSGFALRVVHPIIDANGVVTGDVEFGEEMLHFLSLMKKQTGNDYAMVVDKSKVTAAGWKTYTEGKGKRNNYDDMAKLLVIDSTLPDVKAYLAECFKEEYINNSNPEGTIYSKFQVDGKTIVSGGFSFNDINGKKVGTIVVLQDVTTLESTASKNNLLVLSIAIMAAILIAGIIMLMVSKIVIRPLAEIVLLSTRVAGGDFEAKMTIHTNDEIGQLAETIELFKEIMVNTARDLEKAQKK